MNMNKTRKILALALGSVMALSTASLFAACAKGAEPVPQARICFDNLPDDGIAIPESATKFEAKNVSEVKEYGVDGAEAPTGTVATYADGVLTAKSAGMVKLTLKDGKTQWVDVVPAYVTDPKNQYDTSKTTDYDKSPSKLLGWTHDPSLIETEEDGKPVYYICSTGWEYGNDIHRSEDLIHWEYTGKTTTQTTKCDKIDEWITQRNANRGISWWAPDIVKAPDGGYWLYTCATLGEGAAPKIGTTSYSPACIVLFHSAAEKFTAGSFQYKGVLMQSFIPKDTADSGLDVNSIDPQIIYSPDGKMYMAYGSFGTGNWMLELDPETGLRKDNFYKGGNFITPEQVRDYRDEALDIYEKFADEEKVEHEYYGRMISMENMEAPVIARHDGVTVMDENEKVLEKGKTFYYSMHSYNPLDSGYQMWGGRSEDVWGIYRSTNGGIVRNVNAGSNKTTGNKYMGSFAWTGANKGTSIDIILPGHNDLFTNSMGLNVAAYITRTDSFIEGGATKDRVFVSQIHQYYLNSMGDIVINPNRYGGEVNRPVTKEELFQYTAKEGEGYKFKMVQLKNDNNLGLKSEDVLLLPDGTLKSGTSEIGTWKMYGEGYIYMELNSVKYYGVVRTAWLDDQNKSGFTITCMSHPETDKCSMGLFFNNYSTLTVQ